MDQQILQKILQSCGSAVGEIEKKKISEGFPVLDKASVSALANSLSKLLAYKVSPDAYQRYSARIQIIELIREWIRPPLGLHKYPTFHQGDNITDFILILLKNYFTSEILQNTPNSSRNLLRLGKLLLNLSLQKLIYLPYLKIFLEQIQGNNVLCNEIHEFIGEVLINRDELHLEISLIDKLYVINAKQYLETPIIDNFIKNYERLKAKEQLSTSDEFKKMIDLICSSTKLFNLASNILKQLFLHCDFSLLVIDYIQFVLRNVIAHRHSKNMSLDLYPTYLQSYAALLRIDCKYHTESSKKYILASLSDLYLKNTEQVLILMLHYPNWLEEFSNYVRAFI